jgi:hypothetical protein
VRQHGGDNQLADAGEHGADVLGAESTQSRAYQSLRADWITPLIAGGRRRDAPGSKYTDFTSFGKKWPSQQIEPVHVTPVT